MTELVSIIMPNYNGAKYIRETVESVLSQTYTNWEILLVDDCSTDNSLEIVESYNDARIRIFKNETNRGGAASRNRALREAKGKWIAFLDGDDVWLPEKLEKQIKFMNKNGYGFSYSAYEEMDESSRLLGRVITGPKKVNKRKMFNYDWLGCLTVMYDQDLVGLIQIEEDIKKRNDYAIWLKVCQKTTCYYYPEVLARYRRRKGSVSHVGKWKLLKSQYYLFRRSEKKNAFIATCLVCQNMFFLVWKKLFYCRKKN